MSRHRLHALCLAAALLAAPAWARPAKLPPAAAAVLVARFPGLQVLSHAVGALHAGDAHDVAVVLGRGGRGVRLVAVLWSDAAGAYRFADASGDVDAACGGCDVEVRIREGALEVGASDPGERLATVRTWRFAYRGTRGTVLRLVGVRSEQVARADPAASWARMASTDLLTGEKVDTAESVVGGRRVSQQRRAQVPLRQPILFGQFAFEFRGDAPETRFAFARP